MSTQQPRPSYWPYSPPTATTTSTSTSSTTPAASSHAAAATPSSSATAAASQSGTRRTLHSLLEQIRHMQGLKDVYEVAVKRNGMTTSLALLGGVLFADMLLYRPNNKRQAMLQTSLAAAPHAGSDANSSSSSTVSERSHVAPRLAAGPTHGGVGVPAHA